MGFFDRVARVQRGFIFEEVEREIDREEARKEGVSARTIRKRRRQTERAAQAFVQSAAAAHVNQVPNQRVLEDLRRGQPTSGFLARIEGLTAAEFESLAGAYESLQAAGEVDSLNHVTLEARSSWFPGGERTGREFLTDVALLMNARAEAVEVAPPGRIAKAKEITKFAAIALATKRKLSPDQYQQLFAPWFSVTGWTPG
jgi:hypothetical protein